MGNLFDKSKEQPTIEEETEQEIKILELQRVSSQASILSNESNIEISQVSSLEQPKDFQALTEPNELIDGAVEIMKFMKFDQQKYPVDLSVLRIFIAETSVRYRENIYHHFIHAFSVFQ